MCKGLTILLFCCCYIKSKSGSLVILLSASTTIPGKCNNEEVNELNCFRKKLNIVFYLEFFLTVLFFYLPCDVHSNFTVQTVQLLLRTICSSLGQFKMFVTSMLFLTVCGLKNGRWRKINSHISPILISPIIKPLLSRGWIISKSSGCTNIIKIRKL